MWIMSDWHLWQLLSHGKSLQVWAVQKSLHNEWLHVVDSWLGIPQTVAQSSSQEIGSVEVHDYSSGHETLDWQLSDEEEAKGNSCSHSGVILAHVPVGLVRWSGPQLILLVQESLNNIDVLPCLFTQSWD